MVQDETPKVTQDGVEQAQTEVPAKEDVVVATEGTAPAEPPAPAETAPAETAPAETAPTETAAPTQAAAPEQRPQPQGRGPRGGRGGG
ncbi:MAG: hypothetical protein H0W39_10465, partial [Sphingomonas sp.]|nr:hypothetical protein [Sphingomonas sp.]